MAHHRASESRREQYRRYLEKAGVLDSLTNVLVALYQETEKPDNALDFLKHRLGVADPDPAKEEALCAELDELRHQCKLLMEENRELQNRLLRYEPPREGGTTE